MLGWLFISAGARALGVEGKTREQRGAPTRPDHFSRGLCLHRLCGIQPAPQPLAITSQPKWGGRSHLPAYNLS